MAGYEMADILHWSGVALGLVVVAFLLVGYWRGLSLKPTDPESRPPGKGRWWTT
jgi:hypothetical protein